MILVAIQEGFTHLRVAEQEVEIDAASLRLNDSGIRQRHLALAKQFVNALADEDGQRVLRKPSRSGLREWVQWYSR